MLDLNEFPDKQATNSAQRNNSKRDSFANIYDG